MSQTITLELPEEAMLVYHRGAAAAHKQLEKFIAEWLIQDLPPLITTLPEAIEEELVTMEQLDDTGLWKVAQQQIPPSRQKVYSQLLEKNNQNLLTQNEKTLLEQLGNEARRLTLLRSHAFMILKWRGYSPTPQTMLFDVSA